MRTASSLPNQAAGWRSTSAHAIDPAADDPPGGFGSGAALALSADGCAGTRRGSQPSDPPRTRPAEIVCASAAVTVFAHATRSAADAPGPVLANSLKRAVRSRSGRSQLCQPAGRITSVMRVLRNVTAAKSRHGRPRYVLTFADSAVIWPLAKTNPNGCSAGVEAAV